MTDAVIQQWTQVVPRTTQQANATLDSGAQPWPPGVNLVQGRIDCTPFSGPAATRFDDPSKQIEWELMWSFDGGDTWARVASGEGGSPTGQWGKALNPYPSQELDFSYQSQLPTHFRARATPRSALNFGVSWRTLLRSQSV